jgi:hypothetical protein
VNLAGFSGEPSVRKPRVCRSRTWFFMERGSAALLRKEVVSRISFRYSNFTFCESRWRMNPLRLLLVFGCCASLVWAAPVPKAKESDFDRIEKAFGKPAFPTNSYEMNLQDETLTLLLPEETARWSSSGPLVCPRTEKEVKGDFIAHVRMTVKKPAEKIKVLEVLTGLYVCSGEGDTLTHARMISRKDGRDGRGGLLHVNQNGRRIISASSAGGAFDADSTAHKIERKGNVIVAYSRAKDGDGWHKLGEYKFQMADTVTVGIYADHANGPYTIQFSEFSITQEK